MKRILSTLFLGLALAVAPFAEAATPVANASVTNTAVLVKAGANSLAGYNVSNTNAGTVYVQFFDAATSGAVTVGTTAPYFWIAVPGGSPGGVTDGLQTVGIPFTNGVVIAVTTTPTGGTAPSTGCPVVLVLN